MSFDCYCELFARPSGRRLYPGNKFNGFGKDHSMSHLKALKLASAVPVRATVDPVQRAREKMVATLAEQKQMAEEIGRASCRERV